VAVVGAGPAGASAALHLRRAGCEVLLFDRAAFPRDKPCGDWLTPLAVREIAALGLDVTALQRRAGSSARIRSTSLRAPSGRTSRQAMAPPPLDARGVPDAERLESGLCVPRARLDALLVGQAVDAGCMLRQQAWDQVSPDTPGLTDFDLVVDARGSSAGPVNAVGLRGYWSLPSDRAAALLKDLGMTASADEVAIRALAGCRRGYGWVFPVDVQSRRITFNLGVGLWRADIRPGQGPREMLARFLAQDPLARAIEHHALKRSRPQGFPLALGGWWAPQVGRGRWARIGDAAALADPLTGDGIGNALLSGRLLGAAVAAPWRAMTPPHVAGPGDAWQARFEAEMLPELRRAWLLRQALVPEAAKNAAAWLLEHAHGGLRERLHQAVFGMRSYREAFR
jgi:menaquinone-9 beta-reductase